ncbi:hypothetical protein U1Q18_006631 [Sarracenia purpurea var. burkii]
MLRTFEVVLLTTKSGLEKVAVPQKHSTNGTHLPQVPRSLVVIGVVSAITQIVAEVPFPAMKSCVEAKLTLP